MFNLGGTSEDALENIKSLNICPVSISYEYNPCDALTLPELMTVAKGEKYEKQPMEDLIHMGQGLEGKKGKIEVSFGKPINNVLGSLEPSANNQELFAKVAKSIDKEIHGTYKLMPTNYIAFDLLNKTDNHSSEYTEAEKAEFEAYVSKKVEGVEGDEQLKNETFLKMYAYPVMNKEA